MTRRKRRPGAVVTERDLRLLRTLVLSHCLTRDQIVELFFGTVTRANARLRALRKLGYVRVLDTPFHGQFLYSVAPKAAEVVGERLAPLAAARKGSPRFVRHAISVTNVRLSMVANGALSWKFEQQCGSRFRYAAREWEVRPDGLAVTATGTVAVEVDLGHVAPAKFLEKLRAYEAFALSGRCLREWGGATFDLLVVTTGPRRCRQLARLLPEPRGFAATFRTHDQLGIAFPGEWS